MGDSSQIGDHDSGHVLDVTRLPLDQLVDLDDTVLSRAVRRLVREVENPHESYAGFNSTTA